MKPNALALGMVLLCTMQTLRAQNFTPPEVWTSENFTYQHLGDPLVHLADPLHWTAGPSAPHTAVGNNYEDMLYALPGNYNGGEEHIQEVAFLFTVNNSLAIYTLESRGYQRSSPDKLKFYYDPDVVNQQEGTSLLKEVSYNFRNAHTLHPTIWRFDKTVRNIPVSTIKAAVSGDFNGDQQDEIALFVSDGVTQELVVIQCDNYYGEALNYQMKATTVMTVPGGTLDFTRIRFVSAGKYTETNSKIAVLYDNPVTDKQEIYTIERGGPWTINLQLSEDKTDFDIDKVRFVASGRFERGSTTPRLAIGYDDIGAAKIYISHDNGPSWSLQERFSQSPTQFDYDNIRGVVAGSFDDVTTDEELAIFYDHGDANTGLGSVQQVLVTDHATPSWGYSAAINEKRSAMDFDLIMHAYAANLDYNTPDAGGGVRDEIAVVYNDQGGPNDGQDTRYDKVLVYTNKPAFASNDFMLQVDNAPFIPLGWGHVPRWIEEGGVWRSGLADFHGRAQGNYNTVWCIGVNPYVNPPGTTPIPTVPQWFRQYEDEALALGMRCVQEVRFDDVPMFTTAEYEQMVSTANPASVIAWMTADEPELEGHDYTTAEIASMNNLIRGQGSTAPFMPIMCTDNGFDHYHALSDIVSIDRYPYSSGGDFSSAPSHAALGSAFGPRRAMESAIRYNKEAFVFIPQGITLREPGYAGEARTPGFDEVRHNSLTPIIEGARGLLYYAYNEGNATEVIRRRVDLVIEELAHYIPALKTPSLTSQITIDKNRFVPADFNVLERKYMYGKDPVGNRLPMHVDYQGWRSRYMSLFSYALHRDPNTSRYYLFVANNWSMPVENVEMTAFNVPGTVSLLHPEYFQNGHYTPIAARVDAAGDYVTFTDSFKGNEVKVYAIGDLPQGPVVPPVDSIVQAVHGDLSFSNQRKLVAGPVTIDSGAGPEVYSDDLYYHLVYHRPDPVTGKMKVYYTRSTRTVRNTPSETVQWEPWELELSSNVLSYNGQPLVDPSCAHPSIVVRYDMVNHQNKAYVVFNCQGGPEAPSGYIVESILAADAPTPTLPQGQVLAVYAGRNIDEWGTPMINASSNGNYYVWADSLDGIIAGWKKPQDLTLQGTTEIHWNAADVKAQHPSLNSYSHLGDREDNCALVWQESSEGERPNVYYTRLRGDDNGIGIYLPTAPPGGVPLTLNAPAKTIARVNNLNPDLPTDNTLPTVFRCVEQGQVGRNPGVGQALDLFDRVYWQVQPHWTSGGTIPKWMIYSQVGYRGFDLADEWSGTRWEPSTWEAQQTRLIRSGEAKLTQPNAAQGSMYTLPGDLFASDSAVNLAFTSTADPGGSTSLWHLPHGYTSLVARPAGPYNTVEAATLSNARQIAGPAHSPQLAALPFVRNADDWFRNQRVFNSGSANAIVASRYYFVKAEVADLRVCPMVGFKSEAVSSVVSPFLLDGHCLPLDTLLRDSTGNPLDPGDTISTGWFSVGDLGRLEFALLGQNVTSGIVGGGVDRMEIWLERKLTGARVQLTLPAGNDLLATSVGYDLVHGLNEEYRLQIINRDANAYYTEQIVLDGLPISDTAYADSSSLSKGSLESGPNVLDLNVLRGDGTPGGATLSLYPNPAIDRIGVTLGGGLTVQSGRKLTLTVVSALGTVIDRQEVGYGGRVEIAVDGWSNGAYFVRVGDGATMVAQGSFLIQR